MKLILTAPVEHLGGAGDIVEVKDGYGRNYLLPRSLAMPYNRGTAKQVEGIRRAREAKGVRDNAHALLLRDQLENLQVSVAARTSGERLFGSVTGNDLAQAIKKAGGPALDKRSISAAKPIKTLGRHLIAVKLTDAVTAHLPVEVVAAE